MAAEYIAQRGNLDIVLCERGIRTFETATRNTLDLDAVPVVQRPVAPAGHRRPVARPGRRDLVVPLSRAAIAVGADGIIVDVHPDPERGALRRPANHYPRHARHDLSASRGDAFRTEWGPGRRLSA